MQFWSLDLLTHTYLWLAARELIGCQPLGFWTTKSISCSFMNMQWYFISCANKLNDTSAVFVTPQKLFFLFFHPSLSISTVQVFPWNKLQYHEIMSTYKSKEQREVIMVHDDICSLYDLRDFINFTTAKANEWWSGSWLLEPSCQINSTSNYAEQTDVTACSL